MSEENTSIFKSLLVPEISGEDKPVTEGVHTNVTTTEDFAKMTIMQKVNFAYEGGYVQGLSEALGVDLKLEDNVPDREDPERWTRDLTEKGHGEERRPSETGGSAHLAGR